MTRPNPWSFDEDERAAARTRCRWCNALPGQTHGPFCDGPDGEPDEEMSGVGNSRQEDDDE